MAIIERKSSWGVKVHVGGGKYEWVGSFPFSEFGGKRAAKTAAQKAETKALEARGTTRTRRETCGEFAARWMDDYPRPSRGTNTTYRYAVQDFIREFSDVPLTDTGAQLVRERMRRWGLQQPKSQIGALRAMFNDAKEDGLVTSNPFESLFRSRRRSVSPQVGGKKQVWVPTVDELYRLADCALPIHGEHGPTVRAYILFQAFSGMRPGETAVLEDHCIDFDRMEIHVVKNLDGTGQVNDYTKNGRQRTIALLEGAAEAVRSCPRRLDTDLLFTGPNGAVLGKGPRHNLWNPVRAAFGQPRMRFHSLRHFCATYLLERGASELDVSVQLGHTDGGALVRSTYGHAERSSLDRIKAVDSTPFRPRPVASESHAAGRGA